MEYKLENVSLLYKDGLQDRTILNDISLEFQDRNTYVFLGPSGTGKSSLLYIMSGLREATSGRVCIDGTVITRKNAEKLRYEKFGFVFQQHYLVPYLNVLENICLSCQKSGIKEEAMELLERMGLQDLAQKKPYELSGGQKQRIAVARALVKKPEIIFADEPTASLDQATARQVYHLLRSYSKDRILFMATHDTGLLEGDEQIYKIENCKVVKKEEEGEQI